jgi:hypothetical protein
MVVECSTQAALLKESPLWAHVDAACAWLFSNHEKLLAAAACRHPQLAIWWFVTVQVTTADGKHSTHNPRQQLRSLVCYVAFTTTSA